jgi:hypothetical protein
VGSLWCSKREVHETRHWRCSHRGWLLVHAAKRFEEPTDRLRLILDDEFGCDWAKDLPTGALIGMVNDVDCLPTQTLSGTPLRAMMTESAAISRRVGSLGSEMSSGFSISQSAIEAREESTLCLTT